jgi:exodeoxyribonuclease III
MPTAAPERTSSRRGPNHAPARTVRQARHVLAGVEIGVLTFNISVAAEPRAKRILRWLRRRRDQLIVLSETNGGPGTELIRDGLAADGYSIFATPGEGERGVLIASRLPVSARLDRLSVTLPCRAEGIVLDTEPQLSLLGVYVPSRDRSPEKIARKQKFIASLLRSIEKLPPDLRNNLLLLGDYNAIARHHQPELPGFFPYEYDFHDRLSELGLGAAHELRPYGRRHPHSWIGRTGIGYLYDYAHLGADLAARLRRCQYLHGPRQQRLSDHAALALRVELD